MSILPEVAAPVCPCRSQHAQARKVGRDTLIVHLMLKQYHVLNHVAGRIFDLADGTRSADQIAATIAAECGGDPAIVTQDVTSTLATLAKLRLIDEAVS